MMPHSLKNYRSWNKYQQSH